ncbi:Protease [uncultured virus]|nr:Protease [uncultured virus]
MTSATDINLNRLITFTRAYKQEFNINIPIATHETVDSLLTKIVSDPHCTIKNQIVSPQDTAKLQRINNTMRVFYDAKRPIRHRDHKTGKENLDKWLSDEDINAIMRLVEIKHINFKYLSTTGADCSRYDVCNNTIHPNRFKQLRDDGYNQVGVVFNKSNLGTGGSHWVAVFANIATGNLYYFDSLGKQPNQYGIQYMIDCCNEMKASVGKCKQYINTKVIQTDNYQCGIYSANFIIRMLINEDFGGVVNDSLNYNQIKSCRCEYFSGDGDSGSIGGNDVIHSNAKCGMLDL